MERRREILLTVAVLSVFATVMGVIAYTHDIYFRTVVYVSASVVSDDEVLIVSEVPIVLPGGDRGVMLVVNASIADVPTLIADSTFVVEGRGVRPIEVTPVVTTDDGRPVYGDLVLKVVL